MRVRAMVTGRAMLVILVVLRAGARVLVPVLAVMRLQVDGSRGGGLMVNLTVTHGSDDRLGGGSAVGDQQEYSTGAEESAQGGRSPDDHLES